MRLSDLIKVQLKTIYASPTGNHQPGAEISVSEQEANELVNGGYAVLVPSTENEEETDSEIEQSTGNEENEENEEK